ncbi:MAG: tocopherol cyclase family protein [Dermatophilaceae bacterium]|nr:hypothetical protein [Intrasporangiaceae bacterium]
MRLLTTYRATGADLPLHDPTPAHPGVAMEGYFWRVTVPETGQSVIALIGVNQGPRGAWATLGLAGHPQGSLAVAAHEGATADPRRLGAVAGTAFVANARSVRVDLGPDHRLALTVTDPAQWPDRRLGGSSVFHSVPALNQYWHPWLLGGRAIGHAVLAGERVELTGGQVYGEKNWGREGFPESWWWGQAHGFAEREVCVAFAGGQVSAGPLRTEVTAVVVRMPGGRVLRWGNPGTSPVTALVTNHTWRLRGRLLRPDGLWRVEVDGSAPLEEAHVLPVPLPSEHRNIAGALEHLGGRMQVRVTRQSPRSRRAELVWEGVSHVAGLEHGSLALAAHEIAGRGGAAEATHAPPMRRTPH